MMRARRRGKYLAFVFQKCRGMRSKLINSFSLRLKLGKLIWACDQASFGELCRFPTHGHVTRLPVSIGTSITDRVVTFHPTQIESHFLHPLTIFIYLELYERHGVLYSITN